jgi:ABC-type transport system substrate-binding protein
LDAVDEHTVKFTFSQPFAPFLYTLANDGASIINPAVLKANAAMMRAVSGAKHRRFRAVYAEKLAERPAAGAGAEPTGRK